MILNCSIYYSCHSKCAVFLFVLQVVIDEDDKFLKLLELLGIYQEQGKMHNLSSSIARQCKVIARDSLSKALHYYEN